MQEKMAPPPFTTQQLQERLTVAEGLLAKGDTDNAAINYTFLQCSGHLHFIAMGYLGHGKIHLSKGDYAAALAVLKTGLKQITPDKEASAPEAVAQEFQAMKTVVFDFHQRIVFALKGQGEYKKAINHTLHLIEGAKANGFPETDIHSVTKFLAELYHLHGCQLYNAGDYLLAANQFTTSWSNYTQLQEPVLAAMQCIHAGQSLAQTDYFRRAKGSYKQAQSTSDPYIKAEASVFLAILYQKHRQNPEAIFQELKEGLIPLASLSPTNPAEHATFVRDHLFPRIQGLKSSLLPHHVEELREFFKPFNLEYCPKETPPPTTSRFTDLVTKGSGEHGTSRY